MQFGELLELSLKRRYKYPYKGQITTEDLYQLDVRELDSIYQTLMSDKKGKEDVSLLKEKDSESEILNNKIEIVKHVVEMKLSEAEAYRLEKEKSEKRQEILALISDKENEAMKSKSIEELKAMLNSL